MVSKTAVAGNLALAPRFSDTEPDPSFQPDLKIGPSTSVTLGKRSLLFEASTSQPSAIAVQSTQQVSQLDLFASRRADIVISNRFGELTIFEMKTPQASTRASSRSSIPILLGSGNEQRLVGYLLAGSLVLADLEPGWAVIYSSATATSFPSVSVPLQISTAWAESEGILETLKIQISKLHDEFVQWPGSYNQLLLAGSLDYCRSAISRLKTNHVELHHEVSKAITSYYNLCLGIYHQYREARTALRRVNLQSIQDKFDLLQETCARHGVYPRLEELDVADIPRD